MKKFVFITTVVAIAYVAVLASYVVDRSAAQPTTLGPNVYSLSIGTGASLAAVGANPSRRAVTICNNHASQSINFTFGTTVTPVSTSVGQFLPGGNVAASCFTTPGSVVGGVGGQINMIASGATTPVTVFEY
jgi:hypothetical protein